MVIKESTMWKHIVCCCSYAAFASSVKYVIFAIPFGADSGTEITHHTFGLIIPLCSFLFAPKHLWKWSSLLMGIRCFAKNCLLLFYFIFNSYYFLFQFNQTIFIFIFFFAFALHDTYTHVLKYPFPFWWNDEHMLALLIFHNIWYPE